METEINHHGYSITLKSIPSHFLENIKSELTVKPIENPNFPGASNAFPVYRLSKNKIYLPRYYGIERYRHTTNTLADGAPINVPFTGILREIQEHTIEKTLAVLKEYSGGVISLDTGLGKTVVALKLISLLKQKTLIFVHAEFLLEQWVARIKQFLPDARIGIIRQERCEIENVDITVGMIQTIINRDIDFKKHTYGLMVGDEIHHACARSFSNIFYKVQTKYMIGLSATPIRKDGLSNVLYWFLGPQIVHIKRETGKPTIQFMYTDTTNYIERFNRLGKINNPIMITDLTKILERNVSIKNTILELLKQNRKILVLSDRRDHCEYLLSLVKSDTISAGVYLGGMKTESREQTTGYSVMFGTYQACGEGFDVPELDTLILSTPKSDVEQAVGRILRQKNPNEPLVIDIVDQFSIFKGQFYKRKKFYKTNDFNLK
jgi:superfamily II DNA or RNA helicase